MRELEEATIRKLLKKGILSKSTSDRWIMIVDTIRGTNKSYGEGKKGKYWQEILEQATDKQLLRAWESIENSADYGDSERKTRQDALLETDESQEKITKAAEGQKSRRTNKNKKMRRTENKIRDRIRAKKSQQAKSVSAQGKGKAAARPKNAEQSRKSQTTKGETRDFMIGSTIQEIRKGLKDAEEQAAKKSGTDIEPETPVVYAVIDPDFLTKDQANIEGSIQPLPQPAGEGTVGASDGVPEEGPIYAELDLGKTVEQAGNRIQLSKGAKQFCGLGLEGPKPTSAQTVAAVLVLHATRKPNAFVRSNQLLKNMGIKDQNAESLTKDQLETKVLAKLDERAKDAVQKEMQPMRTAMESRIQSAKTPILLGLYCKDIDLSEGAKQFCGLGLEGPGPGGPWTY